MKTVKFLFKIFAYIFILFPLLSCQLKDSSNNVHPFLLDEITITEIQQGYKNGTYSVKQIVQLYIDRIVEIDRNGHKLNSIIMVNPDALQIADSLDQEFALGRSRGALHGIPVILKDNIDSHDKMPTTAGSRILKDSYPLQDSWVAKKLREAGVVILGKANLSEWANYRASFSSSGWSGVGGQTKNPYVLDRNPCGSSSGSAVAVSANLCAVAIGTETWGSIICPSNANGIVGIKPTVGLWSRSGIVPISYTQDTAGPLARTVRDAAILLGAITGIDSSDQETFASSGNFHRDYGIDRVMDEHQLDAIVSPSGGPAWKTDLINGDNFVLSTSVYAALSGYPNINVPMGFIGDLPVGISFFGRAWSEPILLEIAYAYEQGTQHRKPPQFLSTD